MARLGSPHPEWGPQYGAMYNQYLAMEAEYSALKGQSPPDYFALNKLSAQIQAVVKMAENAKKTFIAEEKKRKELEASQKFGEYKKQQALKKLNSDTPVNTDKSIDTGLADAAKDMTPAHDADAPLGPGFDYTPKYTPPAPTLTATPLPTTPTPTTTPPVASPKPQSKKKYQYYWNDPEWKKKHSYGGSGEWLYGEAPAYGSPGYDGPKEPWNASGGPSKPRRPGGRRGSPYAQRPGGPRKSPKRMWA